MRTSYFAIPTAAACLLVAGCAGPKTTYVNSDSSRLITNVGEINIQDFASAAGQMVDSLLASGKLVSGQPGAPALIAVSLIRNETGQQFDTDLLVKKITVSLNNSGKAQTIATGDPAADAARRISVFNGTARPEDYTLSGKIVEDMTRAGKVRQSSFVFQLSLSSRTGIAIWEEEKTITKQGARPSVGF